MKSLLRSSRRPDITVTGFGRIDISAHIARTLSLKPYDVIDICTDVSDCYLYKRFDASCVVGRHRGQVKSSTSGACKGTLRVWSTELATHLFRLSGNKFERGTILKFPCGEAVIESGIIYLPIILSCKL